jgi:hypothetical protein
VVNALRATIRPVAVAPINGIGSVLGQLVRGGRMKELKRGTHTGAA